MKTKGYVNELMGKTADELQKAACFREERAVQPEIPERNKPAGQYSENQGSS